MKKLNQMGKYRSYITHLFNNMDHMNKTNQGFKHKIDTSAATNTIRLRTITRT